MEYNPLRGLQTRYRSEIDKIKRNITQCQKEISWYGEKSPDYFSDRISCLNSTISSLRDKIDQTERENSDRFGDMFSFLGSVKSFMENFFPKRDLEGKIQEKKEILEEQGRYLSFNLIEKQQYVEAGKLEIKRLENEIVSLRRSVEIVDVALREVLGKIRHEESVLNRYKEVQADLSRIENELNDAENSYERRQIHEECEETYGLGTPGQVRRSMNLSNAIYKAEQALRKLSEEASEIGQISAIPFWCKRLVLDGSNLCFLRSRNRSKDNKKDDKFIGLKALRLIIAELKKRGFDFVVYFDHSTLRSIKREELLALHNDVRISTFEIADNPIVREASRSDRDFILSHDRFHDFANSEVYKEKRIIDVEIFSDEIYIKKLNISIRCCLGKNS